MARALMTERRGILARYSLWNLFGNAVPLAAAVFVVPPLLRALDPDRFGFLTLAWMFVGYLSIFDFGLGRAVTKYVAEKAETQEEHQTPRLVLVATVLIAIIGVGAGLFLAAVAPLWIRGASGMPENLYAEATQACFILAAGVPLTTVITGLRGTLEALKKFAILNFIRAPLGVLTFVGPLIVAQRTQHLAWIVAFLVFIRGAALVAYAVACIRLLPRGDWRQGLHPEVIRKLMTYGGWVTVTNVVSAIVMAIDRLFISGLLKVGMVPYYAVPYTVLTKLWIIPSSLLGVLFPAFSAVQHDRDRIVTLYTKAWRYTLAALFPMTFAASLLADWGLNLWLGREFAERGAAVAGILAPGVLATAMAYVPYGLLHGMGRPSTVAKLVIAETPIYAVALWISIWKWGLVGAAATWLIRAVADAEVLNYLASRQVPHSRTDPSGARLWSLALIGVHLPVVLASGSMRMLMAAAGAAVYVAFLRRFGIVREGIDLAARTWSLPAPPMSGST